MILVAFVVFLGNLDAERISASHKHFVFNIAVRILCHAQVLNAMSLILLVGAALDLISC